MPYPDDDMVTMPGPNGPMRVPRAFAAMFQLPVEEPPAPQASPFGGAPRARVIDQMTPKFGDSQEVATQGMQRDEWLMDPGAAVPTDPKGTGQSEWIMDKPAPEFILPPPDPAKIIPVPQFNASQETVAPTIQRDDFVPAPPPGQGGMMGMVQASTDGLVKPAPPKRPGMTDAGLVAGGQSAVLAEKVAAEEAGKAAAAQQLAITAAGQQAQINATIAGDKERAILLEKQRKEAAADLLAYQDKSRELAAIKQKIADTKIDRKADHPIMSLIFAAITGIGMAVDGKGSQENPALKIMWAGIDRKVAGQMAELEKTGKVYGMTQDELDRLRKVSGDKEAARQILLAGQAGRVASMVKQIGMKTENQLTLAGLAKIEAEALAKEAVFYENATNKATETDLARKKQAEDTRQSDRSAYLTQRGQNMTDARAKDSNALEILKMNRQDEKDRATLRASASESEQRRMDKEEENIRELGISNVDGSGALLQPEGVSLMKQADELEKKAAAADATFTDQGKAAGDMYRKKATTLRVEAGSLKNIAVGRDPTQSGKLSSQYAGSQQVVTLANDIVRMYDQQDGGKAYYKTTAGQAAIQAKSTELMMALKNAWQLGVLSKPDMGAIDRGTGGDPTKWDASTVMRELGIEVGLDPEAFKARLATIKDGVKKTTYNEMRVNGRYRGSVKDLFHEEAPPAKTWTQVSTDNILEEQTPREKADGESQGIIRDVSDKVASVLPRSVRADNEAERKGDALTKDTGSRYTHLTAAQEKLTKGLIEGYDAGDPAAGDKLLEQATGSKHGRQHLATATLEALRLDAPDLYAKALSSMPITSPVRIRFQAEDAQNGYNPSGVAQEAEFKRMPVFELGTNAIKDDRAFAALSAKAAAGDKDAKAALPGVTALREKFKRGGQ